MILEIDNKKVQCPNCPELLARVVLEKDEETNVIYWYHHPYENFCLDIIDTIYLDQNRDNHYFKTIKELFQIEL